MDKKDQCGDKIKKIVEEQVVTKVPKYAEAIAGTIAIAVFLILLNLLHDKIPFLTERFEEVLPFFNFSLMLSLMFNFSQIFIRNRQYKRITVIISNFVFFYLAYNVWNIFPFDTSAIGKQETWDRAVRIIIILTVVVVALSTVVEFVKFILNKKD